MAMIMGLAPIVAPLIGSLLQTAFGWRACFVSIFVAGIIAAAAVRWLLPETLRLRPQAPASGMWAGIRVVARHRGVRAHLAIVAAGYAGLFAFISGSPFVLQIVHGLTPFGFGLSFAAASVGYVVGTSLAARLVIRLGLDRTIGWGALAMALGGVAMVPGTVLTPEAVGGIVAPMMLYLFGMGLAMPQALAGALQPFPDRAGAASSLIGCVQQSVAAATGALVGQSLGATAWPLVWGVAIPGCVAFWVWAATRNVRADRRSGSGRG
jgi:DHA1 family bicyclomycin/chloramphenicol resistance-like MFS transporter